MKLLLLTLWMLALLSTTVTFTVAAQPEPEGDYVTVVRWSPDGSKIAVGFGRGDVEIRDASTNQLLMTLSGHGAGVFTLAWNPESDELVTGSVDHTVIIWDVITGLSLTTITDLAFDSVNVVGWSPNGQYIVIVQDSGNPNLHIWDVGAEQFIFSDTESAGTGVHWSPDGQQIAISYLNTTVEVLDATTFQHIRYLGDQTPSAPRILFGEQILDFAWSPDGNRIVTGAFVNEVTLLDVATGDPLLTLSGNEDQSGDPLLSRVPSVWFAPDGNTFSSLSGDGTLRTWDTATGQVLETSQVANPPILAADVSPDGTRLTYADGTGAVLVNAFPTANAGPDQTVTDGDNSGSELVTLDGSGSTDTDGTIVSYSWTENGIEIATGVTPQVFLAVGVYTVTLTVIDDDGASDVDHVVITVEEP